MAGEPAPALLDPILVLDEIEALAAKPQPSDYQMSMQGLATTGQIEAAFVLITRAETNGLLSCSG